MPRHPRYEGDDVTPTSNRELWGWYTYSLAAEVFAVCGVGSFLPLTLEQLARERGVLLVDETQPCVAPAASTSSLLVRADVDNDQCVIYLLGARVNTASFAMYTFSLAVFIQALVLVSFSSMADYGSNRKRLLIAFGFAGSMASMLFLLVVPQIFLIGSLLVIIGVTSLGSANVILNSFLPLLVLNHPELKIDDSDPQSSSSIALRTLNSNSPFPESPGSNSRRINGHGGNLPDEPGLPLKPSASPELLLSAKISSKGIGIGYAAAVFVQILSIVILIIVKAPLSSFSATLPLRIVLFVVGLWWFSFTLVSSFQIRNRPGPPLRSAISKHGSRWRSFLAYFTFAWVSLWKTIKIAAKLRQVVVFLAAWFLLSDAVATVSGTAILFAKTELHISTTGVALLSILSATSGIVGAFAWPIISRRFRLKTNQTIIACICLFEIIPLYGLMGYLPFLRTWGVGGLQQPWEIYPLGFIHGFVMGGLNSYCRSFFGLLIPPGSEAAFYALYAITDKGSSVFGPAIAGAIVDATGNIRPVFAFLAVLIVLPAPLIWLVDVERGRQDGIRMAETMKGYTAGDTAITLERDEAAEGLLDDSDE